MHIEPKSLHTHAWNYAWNFNWIWFSNNKEKCLEFSRFWSVLSNFFMFLKVEAEISIKAFKKLFFITQNYLQWVKLKNKFVFIQLPYKKRELTATSSSELAITMNSWQLEKFFQWQRELAAFIHETTKVNWLQNWFRSHTQLSSSQFERYI